MSGSEPYFDALCRAMNMLAQHPDTIFMGQGVAVPGTTMSDTLKDVPLEKRLEMPVAEDMQMGMAIGMALKGAIPICIFPRWNFLICAMNQLVNHLDRLPLYGNVWPKVIIRVATPSKHPFNPGPQHDDDFCGLFKWKCLRTVNVVDMYSHEDFIEQSYTKALNSDRSTILVEYTELYKNARAESH